MGRQGTRTSLPPPVIHPGSGGWRPTCLTLGTFAGAGARRGAGAPRAGVRGAHVCDAAEAGAGGAEAGRGAAAEGTGEALARHQGRHHPSSSLRAPGTAFFPRPSVPSPTWPPAPSPGSLAGLVPAPPSCPHPPQAQQRDLTVRRVKETEKELRRQLRQQKEHYEATIQRHLSFIDQVMPSQGTRKMDGAGGSESGTSPLIGLRRRAQGAGRSGAGRRPTWPAVCPAQCGGLWDSGQSCPGVPGKSLVFQSWPHCWPNREMSWTKSELFCVVPGPSEPWRAVPGLLGLLGQPEYPQWEQQKLLGCPSE